MRATLSLLGACLLAMPAAAEPFDQYDPAALVARARQAIREDSLATACVLLTRAGLLAPHDARVTLAWGDYAARQQGLPIGEDAGRLGPGLRRGDEAARRGDEAARRGDEAARRGDEAARRGDDTFVTPAKAGAQSIAKPIAPEPPAPWPAK